MLVLTDIVIFILVMVFAPNSKYLIGSVWLCMLTFLILFLHTYSTNRPCFTLINLLLFTTGTLHKLIALSPIIIVDNTFIGNVSLFRYGQVQLLDNDLHISLLTAYFLDVTILTSPHRHVSLFTNNLVQSMLWTMRSLLRHC